VMIQVAKIFILMGLRSAIRESPAECRRKTDLVQSQVTGG